MLEMICRGMGISAALQACSKRRQSWFFLFGFGKFKTSPHEPHQQLIWYQRHYQSTGTGMGTMLRIWLSCINGGVVVYSYLCVPCSLDSRAWWWTAWVDHADCFDMDASKPVTSILAIYSITLEWWIRMMDEDEDPWPLLIMILTSGPRAALHRRGIEHFRLVALPAVDGAGDALPFVNASVT